MIPSFAITDIPALLRKRSHQTEPNLEVVQNLLHCIRIEGIDAFYKALKNIQSITHVPRSRESIYANDFDCKMYLQVHLKSNPPKPGQRNEILENIGKHSERLIPNLGLFRSTDVLYSEIDLVRQILSCSHLHDSQRYRQEVEAINRPLLETIRNRSAALPVRTEFLTRLERIANESPSLINSLHNGISKISPEHYEPTTLQRLADNPNQFRYLFLHSFSLNLSERITLSTDTSHFHFHASEIEQLLKLFPKAPSLPSSPTITLPTQPQPSEHPLHLCLIRKPPYTHAHLALLTSKAEHEYHEANPSDKIAVRWPIDPDKQSDSLSSITQDLEISNNCTGCMFVIYQNDNLDTQYVHTETNDKAQASTYHPDEIREHFKPKITLSQDQLDQLILDIRAISTVPWPPVENNQNQQAPSTSTPHTHTTPRWTQRKATDSDIPEITKFLLKFLPSYKKQNDFIPIKTLTECYDYTPHLAFSESGEIIAFWSRKIRLTNNTLTGSNALNLLQPPPHRSRFPRRAN